MRQRQITPCCKAKHTVYGTVYSHTKCSQEAFSIWFGFFSHNEKSKKTKIRKTKSIQNPSLPTNCVGIVHISVRKIAVRFNMEKRQSWHLPLNVVIIWAIYQAKLYQLNAKCTSRKRIENTASHFLGSFSC